MDYFVCRMEYQMTDSELATLFDDLAQCLGPDYIEAPTITDHGELILLSASNRCVNLFCPLH